MRAIFLVLSVLALSACGKADNEPGPGGVTAGEAKALDEAAQMIEEDRLPPEAMPTISPTTAPPASPMAPPTPKP
ncbi:MAG: hypothetical protein RL702_230 [Pseudomonadota bacterium]|jgi:hypothetical protein|nr:hypothetical protein [Novosphingobium sp.]HOA49668.1 hypothetical protein [Novosphingobium sp.]HPB21681.1 hypothetical protein [Novosphingobium sp.]HPZ46454.1 hypothetical protein [Novosphingobium sp.]HQE00185.1 hypothetical protein [Novosphingobium sp.]